MNTTNCFICNSDKNREYFGYCGFNREPFSKETKYFHTKKCLNCSKYFNSDFYYNLNFYKQKNILFLKNICLIVINIDTDASDIRYYNNYWCSHKIKRKFDLSSKSKLKNQVNKIFDDIENEFLFS